MALLDTVINYIVAQESDNDYCLTHLYDDTASKAGSLFIDYENASAFTDKNTVIYGHKMRDWPMFSSLKEFFPQKDFDFPPAIYLVAPEDRYSVELFVAFTTSPKESSSVTSL